MDINLVNTHDKFFKYLFSKKEPVAEFVEKTLPVEIAENLHLDTLKLDKTEYLSNNLKTSFSDIVYDCDYGDKSSKIKISLLFEHKSYIEDHPHLQLLGYMHNMWQTQINQKKELSTIMPIIFYHGKPRWKKQPFIEHFKNIDASLQKFIPSFEYQLIDTSNYTNEQIKALFENLELQISLLLMKNIYYEHEIMQNLTVIFSDIDSLLNHEAGEQYFEATIAYIYYNTNIETQKIVNKMREISPKAEQKFVSTAMHLMTKGKEEGIKKVAFNLLRSGIADDIILTTTNLTVEELNYLKTLNNYPNNLGLA